MSPRGRGMRAHPFIVGRSDDESAVDRLTSRPDHALVGVIRMPEATSSPVQSIVRRVIGAMLALAASVLIVYLDRDGYRDAAGGELSLLDCVYYATVSLSTTGYGDITPVSPEARLVNVLIITPLRVLFLIVLVGTTLEVLTERSRQAFKIQRWRSKVRDHVVVIGYGTKGRSAVKALLGDDLEPGRIVVVDTDHTALEAASSLGLVTVNGSGTRSDVLRVAGIPRARAIVVAPARDDTAVLVTLTARELAPKAQLVAAVREAENVHLLRQSGADSVVVSSETAGRLLGMATTTPSVVEMFEDLLTPDVGLAIAERDVEQGEVGGSPRHLPDIVLGVVREGRLYRVDAPEADAIEQGDRLLYVKKVSPADR
ncbi:voltage-gated potassium channel [Saccharopolyspora erythraea NRRL 2338]|uniref:Possible transmembrane cation transporter n=3 Tax=Saccharopolyspora erythraea TaxID=1836 RepID=A4F8N8_SACEN|nr:NAD-binding protein of Kef-type K+ transporter [Saccharopolyspora erythraea D]PFG94207.1 voltage-gated potassium channel [Saccharopolyspora erythraea NRRL 2338]CAM00413.1 possible transmembrane cation transporter [Saccharopolyspora erythraea NRRL 2338]